MPSPEHAATDTRGASSHLPTETQRELARAAQAGSMEARDLLLSTNMRLLQKIVRQSTALKRGCEYEDLMQEACMGFMRGIELFDPENGTALTSFAYFHAQARVGRYMMTLGRQIRVSVDAQMVQQRAALARERLGEDSSDETIAADIGTSVKRLRQCDEYALLGTVGLSHVLSAGGGYRGDLTVEDVTPDPRADIPFAAVDRAAHLDALAKAANLDPREFQVISLIWLHGMAQVDIAPRVMGRHGPVTRQRVGQIKAAAITKLRRAASVMAGVVIA